MYTEKRPAEANTPDGWAATLKRDPLSSLKLRADLRWPIIRDELKSPLLDAGCGRGDWVSYLASRGYDATGLDYSTEMVAANRLAFPESQFDVGSLQAMPYPDGRFQSIVSWGVIEHDPEGPGAALAEFHRVLAPSGRILVTVPIDSEAQRAASQLDFEGGEHFFQFFFTQDELSQHVADAGFDVLRTGFCSRPHPFLIWPEQFKAAGGAGRRLMQLRASFADACYGNMIFCLAMRPV